MQQRPASRLLVLNRQRQVLLFRFEHAVGPLAGLAFWATPGGGVDDGESYADAARRELYEEVGLVASPGEQVAQKTAVYPLPSGETVESDERYFIVDAGDHAVSNANWTELEHQVIAAHRWWRQAELAATAEQVWPEDLADLLIAAGAWPAA